MANDCTIKAFLRLKPDVTEEQVYAALQPMLDRHQIDVDALTNDETYDFNDLSGGGKYLEFSFDIAGIGGHRDEDIALAARNLAPLLADHKEAYLRGNFMLHLDFVDHDMDAGSEVARMQYIVPQEGPARAFAEILVSSGDLFYPSGFDFSREQSAVLIELLATLKGKALPLELIQEFAERVAALPDRQSASRPSPALG